MSIDRNSAAPGGPVEGPRPETVALAVAIDKLVEDLAACGYPRHLVWAAAWDAVGKGELDLAECADGEVGLVPGGNFPRLLREATRTPRPDGRG